MQPPNYYGDLAQALLNMGEQRDAVFQKVVADYNLTLKLLQDIKDGNVDIQQLSISDDGWELMPEQPQIDRNGQEERHLAEAAAV